jgi:hypothetical protein
VLRDLGPAALDIALAAYRPGDEARLWGRAQLVREAARSGLDELDPRHR